MIPIDFDIDDSRSSVAALVSRLGNAWNLSTDPGPLTLDLKACKCLGPDGVVILSALVEETRRTGRDLILIPPEHVETRVDVVRRNRGRLAFYSRAACAYSDASTRYRLECETLSLPFPGTLATMSFRIDNALYADRSDPAADIEI